MAYGTCSVDSLVVRIKMKYADDSRAFFEDLLERFKARFGKNPQWVGDSFGIVIAWKWSYWDKGDNITLTLQHNIKDRDQKMGNSVKLKNDTLILKEKACCERDEAQGLQEPTRKKGKIDWDLLIPRK